MWVVRRHRTAVIHDIYYLCALKYFLLYFTMYAQNLATGWIV